MKKTFVFILAVFCLFASTRTWAYLPDPPDNATKVEVGRNFTKAAQYFWVEQGEMYVQVVPETDRFYACGLDWSVIQDGEYKGYMKFSTEYGTSFCADIEKPQTFVFTNWDFFPAPDYDRPMTLVYTGNDGYNSTFQFPAEPITVSYEYYAPYFKFDSSHWTGLAITNMDSDHAAQVDVTLYGSDGWALDSRRVDLEPKGQTAYVLDNGGDETGWIQVESTRKLAGLVFAGQTGTSGTMVDVPFTDKTHEKLILPHAAFDSSWDTTVYVANPNEFMASVTLTFHTTQGEEAGSVDLNIFGQASEEVPLSAICHGKQYPSGSVEIRSDEPVCAFAIYSNAKIGGKSAAGIAATPVE